VLTETLAALAGAAGTGVVTAMVTDGWQQAKTQVARMLGRGDAQEEERQEARLERARQELMEAPDGQAEELRRRQGEAWRTRFEDLLEDAPEVEAPLRELVAFIAEHSSGPAVAGAVQVNAEAHDQSQQAVQGQGVQNITFGSQPKP
jgi:TolA-binding protein